ncbi:uncharacterized protein LY79DRAFT_530171 [Colletotrichum navitas]|uniref:Ubiquitin-like protease family profile domain-containing protein n=1 Tax=Colletotrichum navitas TaxID=681940 RepID=A0AAD8PJB4_9PEZI|nr:uncharacterized protein LY79DRAFT_530171 [Colletotrichum navitas]KAK1564292.1 hypothetical protein LY79DRAFT_530171 [Colletotrichum navitas]
MAARIMVRNLNSPERKTLKTQIEIQRNALKRSKQKVDYLHELDRLWGSRDAWLPPRYRSKRNETPGLNIVVYLRSITQKALKLGIPLPSLWEDGGALLETSRHQAGNNPPILNARSAEVANREFSRYHSTSEDDPSATSSDRVTEIGDPPAEISRHGFAQEHHQSSPSPLFNSDSDDGDFGAFGGVTDLDFDSDGGPGDLEDEIKFNAADLSLVSLSAVDENAAPTPEATPGIALIAQDDVQHLPVPTGPEVVLINDSDTDPVADPLGLHLLPSSVTLFLRIKEQLSNNVCLHDDVLWYALWSAMPSARQLAHRKIILVDPLLLSIDAWQPDGTGQQLPHVLLGKLDQCTIYAPVHHRNSGHWTTVQVTVGASRVTVNHFDSLYSAFRSLRVKRVFDRLFREACPGREIEFVEAACPQQLDSVSCGVYAVGVIRRLVDRKCVPRHMNQEEERKSLLAMLPDHQALCNTFDRERGARLHSRKGQLRLKSISSVSSDFRFSDEAAQDRVTFLAVGKSLKAMAQHGTLIRLAPTSMAPHNSRLSAHSPAQAPDLVTQMRKRKRSSSPPHEEDERPTKHRGLTDWAREVSKQASTFAWSDDVLDETTRRLLRTRHEQVACEGRLSEAIRRVGEAETALGESNERAAAAEFLDAVQHAARGSADRIIRRTGNGSLSKILETINASIVMLTAALGGPGVATSGKAHEELAGAEKALQAATDSVTGERQGLQVIAARRQQDEALLRQQEGLKLVRDGLAKIQSWFE